MNTNTVGLSFIHIGTLSHLVQGEKSSLWEEIRLPPPQGFSQI
jgi:hypothetical protein